MNDRVLVEALRARAPGAFAALYDAYAEEVYRYCWSLLLSAESAQVALRDTLIAAEAHAAALADPGRLRTWLYALARAECLRRRAAAPPDATAALAEAPPPDDPADADLRVMAWNAVHGLPAADREILELSIGHGLPDTELAQVLARTPRQVEAAMTAARDGLSDAVTAEILARKGPYDCPRRAAILTGFSGHLTPEMRERLIGHLPQCATCSPHRGRQVSPAKVFDLLPHPVPPGNLRLRVMSCFADPELLPYRRYVARRAGPLGVAGFPAERPVRRWPQALAGALAAVAAVVAIAVIFHQLGPDGHDGAGTGAAVLPAATGDPPTVRSPEDLPPTAALIPDTRSTRPLGTLAFPALLPSTQPGTRPETTTNTDQTPPAEEPTPERHPADDPDKSPPATHPDRLTPAPEPDRSPDRDTR
ncbi:MAG TPA: hypothetical protein VFV66_16180, partial [Nonomuraea sp.]|nr:hypothetical protein [Nonomuraea sp.]